MNGIKESNYNIFKFKGVAFMQTRWKRQRLAHQETTLKRVLGGVPRDVLGLLKGYLTEIDFFLLCEAFDCRVERPSVYDLLEGAIKTNRVEIVEYMLSVIKVKPSVKNMWKWTSEAAALGNVSILRLLRKHEFYISGFTTEDVINGSGNIECYRYLVEKAGCLRQECFYGGHLDLILYENAAHIERFKWSLEILVAIRKNHINLLEHVKMHFPHELESFFAKRRSVWKTDFHTAVLKHGFKVTQRDMEQFFRYDNRIQWIYEAIENHGDFFLTPDAKKYLQSRANFQERLRQLFCEDQ